MIDLIRKSDGFMTAKDQLIDYTEWHSFIVGLVLTYLSRYDSGVFVGLGFLIVASVGFDIFKRSRTKVRKYVQNEPLYFWLGIGIGATLVHLSGGMLW